MSQVQQVVSIASHHKQLQYHWNKLLATALSLFLYAKRGSAASLNCSEDVFKILNQLD